MSLGFCISFNTRFFTSIFIFSLKINPEIKMRGLRKMLTISTVNQVEGKNIIQILLVQYCKYGTFMFFSGFIIEIFNHLCCSLDTRNTRNLFLSRTKLLCKIKNFKRIAWGLVHLSAIPTEVGRKFAKLTKITSGFYL